MSAQEVKRDVMCLTVGLCVQLPEVHANSCDNISQFSVDSITSLESKEPVFIAAGDIRCSHAHATVAHVQIGVTSVLCYSHPQCTASSRPMRFLLCVS